MKTATTSSPPTNYRKMISPSASSARKAASTSSRRPQGENSERPILMSGPMVRAILEGLKCQTRRAIKPQPATTQKLGKSSSDIPTLCCPDLWSRCPYGKTGDYLWVRETWQSSGKVRVYYRADMSSWGNADYFDLNTNEVTPNAKLLPGKLWQDPVQGWRPAIHMPRWASRLTLKITNVRVERVQDISAADCKAEGLVHEGRGTWSCPGVDNYFDEGFKGYRHLWDALATKEFQWSANPWCWVIEFKRVTT